VQHPSEQVNLGSDSQWLVVTEKDASGAMKPLAIATKVDLLTWMLHQSKANKPW
jgi:hypothetical protein